MAYLENIDVEIDPETGLPKNQQSTSALRNALTSSAEPTSFGSTPGKSLSVTPTNAGAPTNSGTYTNLQKYLSANAGAGEQMANKITSGYEKEKTGLMGQITNVGNQASTLQDILRNPSAYTPEQYQTAISTNPIDFKLSAEDLSNRISGLGTESGRFNAINKISSPNATSGTSKLNQYLFAQGGKSAIENYLGSNKNLPSDFSSQYEKNVGNVTSAKNKLEAEPSRIQTEINTYQSNLSDISTKEKPLYDAARVNAKQQLEQEYYSQAGNKSNTIDRDNYVNSNIGNRTNTILSNSETWRTLQSQRQQNQSAVDSNTSRLEQLRYILGLDATSPIVGPTPGGIRGTNPGDIPPASQPTPSPRIIPYETPIIPVDTPPTSKKKTNSYLAEYLA